MVASMNLSFLSTRLLARVRKNSALRLSLIVMVGLSAVSGAACGNDDPDPRFSSGLDDQTTASTLDDDDKHTFCRTLDAHVNVVVGFEEIARIACLPRALLAGTRDACEQALDDCARNAPAPITVNASATREQACFDDLDSCEANVGTLESCVNVNVGIVRQLLESFTCARFGNDSAGEVMRAMETAGTCAKASSSCGQATQILL
jgi:hypothetical protein